MVGQRINFLCVSSQSLSLLTTLGYVPNNKCAVIAARDHGVAVAKEECGIHEASVTNQSHYGGAFADVIDDGRVVIAGADQPLVICRK